MMCVCLQALHVPHPRLVNMQDDMNEVSQIAHNIKSRLEHLQRVNEAALDRKASLVQFLYSASKRVYRQKCSVTPALSQPYTDKFETRHVWQTLQMAAKISAHMAPACVEGNSLEISLPVPTVCDVSFADTELCNCAVQATDSKQDVCFYLNMP